jgi:hypothetical protein
MRTLVAAFVALGAAAALAASIGTSPVSRAAAVPGVPARALRIIRAFGSADAEAQALTAPARVKAGVARYLGEVATDPAALDLTMSGANAVISVIRFQVRAARYTAEDHFSWDAARTTVSNVHMTSGDAGSIRIVATVTDWWHIHGQGRRDALDFSGAADPYAFTFVRRQNGWELSGLVHIGSW